MIRRLSKERKIVNLVMKESTIKLSSLKSLKETQLKTQLIAK